MGRHARSAVPRSSHCSRRLLPTVLIFAVLLTRCYGVSTTSSQDISRPTKITLRVRMADGAVSRVRVSPQDTINRVMGILGLKENAGEGLTTEQGSRIVEGKTSIRELGVGNGDFLYMKSKSASEAAVRAKAQAVKRMRSSTAPAAGSEGRFVPFPSHARPRLPSKTKRMKNWQDIEAMQARTFSLKPQKESNVKKISVEQAAMDDFVGHLKATGLNRHRCALLLGRVNPATKAIKVEAMYEPRQEDARMGDSFDATALMNVASDQSEELATSDLARAVRVAKLLGLRVVGCCLSHDKREHFMGAVDVMTSTAVQLWAMRTEGHDAGILTATLTVSVNQTDGEIATEAFTVSNQTVQMYSEDIFARDQPDPAANRITTNVPVREDGKETCTPETVGMICNVAITQHNGVLQTRFPAANRGIKVAMSELEACVFGRVVPHQRHADREKKPNQPSLLKRLSDFQLLVFLSRQMGFCQDFEELCSCVRRRDAKSPVLKRIKVVLESMCAGSEL